MKVKNQKIIRNGGIIAGMSALIFLLSATVPSHQPSATTQPRQADATAQSQQPSATAQPRQAGIYWPEDHALPFFATPASPLKVIDINPASEENRFSGEEINMFSCFQGLVNKVKPEIVVYGFGGPVRREVWLNELGLAVGSATQYVTPEARYRLVYEYKDRVKGLVVYNAATENNSPLIHYRNAAATIANVNGYLPVTPEIKEKLAKAGLTFAADQIIDITGWPQQTALDIYQRIYDEYWPRCTKRLLVHMNGGNPPRIAPLRDIAAATGAAVIWLDTKVWNKEERALYQKFMKDMADAPGTAIVLGWGTTERSVITAGAEYGISLIPSDDYANATVFSATDHTILVPKVPKRPPLENKLYLAMYITDGDNIQYVQGSMKSNWDNAINDRGRAAVNWTISPGLVDIGPGILNYYYRTSSAYECFVAGPSGMGYIMPLNTLPEAERDGRLTALAATFLTDKTYMDNYTRLTETYLRRSGMRAVTIWDDANTDVKNSFERNCRYLYGATIHAFGRGDVSPVTINNRLHFSKHTIHYESNLPYFKRTVSNYIESTPADSPQFTTYQLNGWRINTGNIVSLYDSLKTIYNHKFEFVRADHYYSYYNECHHFPFNLNMLASTRITSSDVAGNAAAATAAAQNIENAADGTPSTLWISSQSKTKYLQFEFDRPYSISRYVLRLAEANGLSSSLNIKSWKVEVSTDGKKWTSADEVKNNTAAAVDKDLPPVAARWMRITFTDTGSDPTARIADVEIYGSV